MKNIFTILIALFIGAQGFSQEKESYKFFHPNNNHKSMGYFGAVVTSVSRSLTDPVNLMIMASPTTPYNMERSSRGALGLGLEGGAFFVPEHGPFGFVDFGIGYHRVRGFETINAQRAPGSDLSFPDNIDTQGKFVAHHIKAHLNPQFMHVSGRSTFLHGGLGVYFDHILLSKADYDVTLLDLDNSVPETRADAGFNLTGGIAFKVGPAKYLDFYGHLPLYSLGGSEALDYQAFTSTYRNYVIGVRYMWLSAKPDRICPAFSGGSQGARFSKKRSPPAGKRPW
jgi:hypothetical protein